MSPEVVGIVGLFVLIGLLACGINIGFAMLAVGFTGYAYIAGIGSALSIASTTIYHTIAFYSISVIPMFMLMGTLLSKSQIGEDLFRAAYLWLGGRKGGLGYATIAACTLFAAACGSSFAETMTMGRLAIPEMRKYNYTDSFAAGCVACAGSLAILMPPSIAMIVYAILTEQSVGLLFIGGIIPAIILASLFACVVLITTKLKPDIAPASKRYSFSEKIRAVRLVGPFLLLFLLIFGGIYGGIFTPTEAGAIGAFGALMIGLLYGKIKYKNLIESIQEAAANTAMMTVVMAGAFVFMKFIAVSQLPVLLSEFIKQLQVSRYFILFAITVIYIILGMFLDILSAIPLTIPIVYPVILSLGFDPIWFGVYLVVLMEAGLVTPPIGLNVFLLSGVTKIDMDVIFKGVWPFVMAMFAELLLLALFPQLVLWLPQRMTS